MVFTTPITNNMDGSNATIVRNVIVSSPIEKPRHKVSLRPEKTAEIIKQTGLTEEVLEELVNTFYTKVRRDPMLGPIFNARINDWPAHLEKLSDFWSSVALMSGRYHGQPMQAHMDLPIQSQHFARWLELFSETAISVCPAVGAKLVIARANTIASALSANIRDIDDGVGLGEAPPNLGGT